MGRRALATFGLLCAGLGAYAAAAGRWPVVEQSALSLRGLGAGVPLALAGSAFGAWHGAPPGRRIGAFFALLVSAAIGLPFLCAAAAFALNGTFAAPALDAHAVNLTGSAAPHPLGSPKYPCWSVAFDLDGVPASLCLDPPAQHAWTEGRTHLVVQTRRGALGYPLLVSERVE